MELRQDLPDRREGHLYRPLGPPPATAGGGRLWERFYELVERPAHDERPALWTVAWLILPLLAGVAALWVSAPLALAFEGPEYSWAGFAIALALIALAIWFLARPAVLRLARERDLRPVASEGVAGWSVVLCLAAAAAGAAAGQGLDNGILMTMALTATGAALLVVGGLATRVRALYLAGMALTWGVLVLGAFVAVLALVRTGACAVGDCL